MKRTSILLATAIFAQQALVPWAIAANYNFQSGQVEGFVVPSSVKTNEPFTFAAKGTVEGEVVEIKTVEGEVVATKKTDKYGRVFLATGLAAGVYLLSHHAKSGSGNVQAPLEVINPTSPPNPSNALNFEMPKFVGKNDGVSIKGTGFSGDASDLEVKIGNKPMQVLASSPTGLKTGPLPSLNPGECTIDVKNLKTGDSQKGNETIVYDIQSKLTQQKVSNGQLTMVEFTLQPKSIEATVKAKITNGPVHFTGGGKETNVVVKNGSGKAPILADPTGSGKFNLSWEIADFVITTVPGGKVDPGNESKDPCPATKHTMKPTGVWKDAGKRGELFVATRERQCYVQECRLKKGHGGDHEWGAPKACPDKDKDTEEKTFDTDGERAKFIKESKAGGG